jgi:hypothetical protein
MVSLYKTEDQLLLHMARSDKANSANARAAIVYLNDVLQHGRPGPWAVIGGFSVSLRGCKRAINHVDIAAFWPYMVLAALEALRFAGELR